MHKSDLFHQDESILRSLIDDSILPEEPRYTDVHFLSEYQIREKQLVDGYILFGPWLIHPSELFWFGQNEIEDDDLPW
jgi:hypothetical protein